LRQEVNVKFKWPAIPANHCYCQLVTVFFYCYFVFCFWTH